MSVRFGVWIVAGLAAIGLFGRCVESTTLHSVDPPSTDLPSTDSVVNANGGSAEGSVDRLAVDPKGASTSESPGPITVVSESDTLVDPVTGETAYRIRFKPSQDRPLYYVIENEYRERGGFLGTFNLSYSTRASDRRSIIQRRLPTTPRPSTTPRPPSTPSKKGSADQSPLMNLKWQCDRYEFREKGMGAEVKYDSLRDLYPVSALRGLGTIAGSTATFTLNPETGVVGSTQITLARMTAPVTRKKLSSLANRCTLTRANLQKLLDDLGALFLPGSPKRIGESWTRSRRDAISNYGHSVLDYQFTLAEVRDVENRHVARIEIGGDLRLEPTPVREGALARKRAKKRIDYKIDSAACSGSIEFDITRGELVSLRLRRESELSAKMPSKDNEPTTVEKGASQVLRVAVSDSPPPKPMIVGGPKPPVEKESAKRGTGPHKGRIVKDPNAARRRATPPRPNARPPIASQSRGTPGRPGAVAPRGGRAIQSSGGKLPLRVRPIIPEPVRGRATTRPTTQPSN